MQFGCSSMYTFWVVKHQSNTFWVVKHQSNTFFDYFVCKSMGSSATGSTPTTTYLLMHNFLYFVSCRFQSFVFKKRKNSSLILYQTYLDMWSILEWNLIILWFFEKSCNSSTLLMELFVICGQIWQRKVSHGVCSCVALHRTTYSVRWSHR